MHVFTIDVGGTAIKYAALNDRLEINGKGEIPTPLVDYENFLYTITELVQRECQNNTASDPSSVSDETEGSSCISGSSAENENALQYSVEGISISLPGVIDSENGKVLTGGMLYFNAGHDVAADLSARLGLPVYIENDAKCAILAEAWKGSLSDADKVKNAVVLILGTGLGGGIIIDRKLYKGRHFSAGEFSFIKETVEEPAFSARTDSSCRNDHAAQKENAQDETLICGQKYDHREKEGNTEKEENVSQGVGPEYQAGNICSATGLIALAREETGAQDLDGRKIFEAVHSGDPAMLRVLRRFARRVALFIYNTHMFIDPDCIALGGGISRQDILLEQVREEVQKIYSDPVFLQFFPVAKPPEVVQCRFFNDANLVGAMYNYICRHKQG